ncbi:S8 family serine peptidase [Vibrio nigripulchritudo]|uniref:S8 family serine peptidase n=1 Tax=Vibrio nigripulchritudo TaxID=28173 RepID=UPI0024929412|nr:S8 family serine peptidase [Vibrio nigripulchritudo]BDU38330.1 peptidase S8 [Vibrio nigripulchritudo]BDU44052.1 peptidase S8 [Vibrio nigripulchritudo]
MKIEHRYRKATLALMIASALAGCNDSDSTSSTTKNTAPVAAAKNAEKNVVAQDVQHWKAHRLNRYLSENLSTWSIEQEGKVLTATEGVIETQHGHVIKRGDQLVYVSQSAQAETFTLKNDSGTQTETVTIKIDQVLGDPLADQQWHLHNTGQMAYAQPEGIAELWHDYLMNSKLRYSRERADEKIAELQARPASVAGEDMNVPAAFALGVTGKDTIVVVVDSGLEIAHEDLVDNVLPNRSLNFKRAAHSPTDPTNTGVNGDHGTSVAGLIAAKGWNNLGGRGVAPDASLIGMNFLETQSDSDNMISHGMTGSGISVKEPVVAFNRSYGRDLVSFQSYDEIDAEMTAHTVNNLRDGKGALNVKSSGNSFVSSGSTGDFCQHTGAIEYGLTCTNSALESNLSFEHYIAIGAVNADGTKSSYSTAGANIFVSAPAGENGDWEPAMVTPDQSTCLRGYAGRNRLDVLDNYVFEYAIAHDLYPFNAGKEEDNLTCHYTNTFNGTSSAAPNTSGVVALIASANPSLSWRDIKHILASTSDRNNPEDPTVSIPAGNGNFVAHLGWIENGAGYQFNNHYGFGRVNAGEAVKLALDYKQPLPAQIKTDWTVGIAQNADGQPVNPITIPDNNASGAELIVEVADNVTIESMQFMLDIYNEEFIKDTYINGRRQSTAGIDLAIEVTSPAGTKSILLSSRQAILEPVQTAHSPFPLYADGYILKDSLIAANAFYGENAKGKWKLRFLDTSGSGINEASNFHSSYFNNTVNSLVKKANLRVVGH